MCIYYVRHPMKSKPIGKMHTTLGEAKRAALRAAKRDGHARVDHWKDGPVLTMFPDGKETLSRKTITDQ